MSERFDAALGWFFGRAAAHFERSPLGPTLDHLETYALKRIAGKCRKCKMSQDPGTLRDGSWCDRCHGTGGIVSRLRADMPSDDLMPVNETRTSSGGYLPDDATVTRFAVISRRLTHFPPAERAALAAYHGDAGIRCDSIRRIISVYPLVPAGSKLILLDSQVDAPPYERAFRQVAAQTLDTKDHRGALIAAADEQAEELYTRAWWRWTNAA